DNRWNDYSQVDAIVAVRSFDQQQLYLNRNYISKPATKLYNAWLAGVPAILGCESAYQAERQHPLDYLEVTSPTDILSVLKRLRDEPSLRQEIVKNGQIRAQQIHPSNITSRWCNFLNDIAVPTYYRWCAKPRWLQQFSLGRNYLTFNVNRGQYKMRTALAAPLTSLVSQFKAY
ncbi:MAG: glycosyltransferase family 1 protein, partial [Microcoleus sp. SIO2G3]|nr:glycosyltransferase family 1 protein [Microcoleus sp. SIO2G3]